NFDGIITRLEYSAKGGTDMQGYTNWAIDALNDILDDSDKAKKDLVSGALQDLKRAIIIGENTFGKGSVQQIIPINETEALRLTIA
ncbi:S41 family peptidase, partial [Campylobacter coli]